MKYSECKTEWVRFGKIKDICFVGRDAICFGGSMQLIFINLITNEELLYLANTIENGEGVRCYTGHKTVPVFAFAEKCGNPMIIVKTYPQFKTICALPDGSPEGYISLVFSESSLLISLGYLPRFLLTVWNWRLGEKITTAESDILQENQILRPSFSTPICLAQLGIKTYKLNVWDILRCGKKCIMTKFEVDTKCCISPFSSVLWTSEGGFYVLDKQGNIYMMTPDYKLENVIETHDLCSGITSFTWYKGGITVSGPNQIIKHYKKSGEWQMDWYVTTPEVCKKITSSSKDFLIILTESSEILLHDSNTKTFKDIKTGESSFNDVCLIYPTGEYIVTLTQEKRMSVREIATGKKVDSILLQGNALAIKENPEFPYVGVAFSHGVLELFSIYNPEEITSMASFVLTKNPLSSVYFTEIGRFIVTADMTCGQFFVIEGIPGTKMQVIATVTAYSQIADYILVASRTCLRLFAIIVTSENFIAGNKIIRYCIIKGKAESDRKEYKLENSTVMYSRLYATTKPNRDRIFYAIPFKSKYIHEIETKRADPFAKVINTINTGHQMRKIGLQLDQHHMVTYAYDGLVIIYEANMINDIGMIMAHHRYDKGVVKAYIDPLSKYIISIGRNNTLICTSLNEIEINTEKQEELRNLLTSPKYTLMFKKPTSGFVPTGVHKGKTWLEVKAIQKEEEEREMCAEERVKILNEFKNIQWQVQQLLTENINGPENEIIDVQQFNLDTEMMDEEIKRSQKLCHTTKMYLEALIVAQDNVTKWLKTNFWDKMSTIGKTIWAIFANFNVENYVLLPNDLVAEGLLRCIEEQRKLEDTMSREDSFEPWIPMTKSEVNLKMIQAPVLAEKEKPLNILEAIENEIEEEEEPEKEKRDEETYTAFAGSITHTFLELNEGHYSQQQLCTFLQTEFQTLMSLNENRKLKELFNKQFENLASQKVREMINVKDRNARLRHIISEINYFSVNQIDITIDDPEWKQDETPELITKVNDKEVSITPYISPSEQAILDAKAAEEERIRLLLLADDFRERALMAMMNGVLEVRWEDELRKEVPVPKCMLEKEPEHFNEEDLRNIRDYEEKVKFLNSERERYKNILDMEYGKLGNILRESVKKYNGRLSDLFLMKIHIDSAVDQENLKINRMRLRNHRRIMTNKKEINIRREIAINEAKIDEIQQTITSLYECLNESRAQHDLLQTKEKILDKAFKRDFLEASPVVQEVTQKLYKKRPKINIRAIASPTLLRELGKCVTTQERTTIINLNHDCIDFMKAVDVLDMYVGVPNAVDEFAYSTLCKHRRLKIECEIKIKAASIDIWEAESTLSIFQKALAFKKDLNIKLINKLSKTRTDKIKQAQDMEIQIVMKQGFVEVPMTGEINDFNDAILIARKEVEDINKIIISGGNRKLKAMRESMEFRRGIILMEWEHRRLKMQIADLEEQHNDIHAIKVTKEIQSYLKSKARGDSLDKMLTFEQEVEIVKASFERIINDKKFRIEELQKQINSIKAENKILDKTIAAVNVDVCEYKLEKDDEMEKKEQEIIKNRMKTLLKRAKLVKEIQENHNEILVLQTELELVRLKVFPTLKYKLFS